MTMKDFIEMKEGAQKKEMDELLSKIPAGTRVETTTPKNRSGLEKSFEWELMYAN